MVLEILILTALIAWSFYGVRYVIRTDDTDAITILRAFVLGPAVLFMWLVMWVASIRVTFKRRL